MIEKLRCILVKSLAFYCRSIVYTLSEQTDQFLADAKLAAKYLFWLESGCALTVDQDVLTKNFVSRFDPKIYDCDPFVCDENSTIPCNIVITDDIPPNKCDLTTSQIVIFVK